MLNSMRHIKIKIVFCVLLLFLLVSASFGSAVYFEKNVYSCEKTTVVNSKKTSEADWAMQGYNRSHVGRSPYSTADNPGIEKWRFTAKDWCDGSPVIDQDGAIYFGDADGYFYALYPDGTLKWKFEAVHGLGDFGSAPAVATDGTIYVAGKYGSPLFAINPDGTEKWRCWNPEIDTSITIDDNGVLYYGHWDGVDARYPNGTLKWRFYTEQPDSYVMSTPAVDDNGTIYFGSHDHYIYAVFPNGTLNWRYETGNWVHGSPTIGSDGTIYCGSDDDYLYALYPQNGSLKWKVKVGSMLGSPSLDKENNLYFGVWQNKIYSVSPEGMINWEFTIGNRSGVWGSTAAVSADGTVYVGSSMEIGSLGGGEIIALNADGTVKWRKVLSDSLVTSSPIIAADGTVYICSSNGLGHPSGPGNLHAFGPQETNTPPSKPTINGLRKVHARQYTSFSFTSTDPENNPISYYVKWGDGTTSEWIYETPSGRSQPLRHQWLIGGVYTIRAKARDSFGAESDWATFLVITPKNQSIINPSTVSLLTTFYQLRAFIEKQ